MNYFVQKKKNALGEYAFDGLGASMVVLTKTDLIPKEQLCSLLEEWKQWIHSHLDLKWYEIIPISSKESTDEEMSYIFSQALINSLCRGYLLHGDTIFEAKPVTTNGNLFTKDLTVKKKCTVM